MIGPNGSLPREITAMHPDAPYIKRIGEVDAWDNEDFGNGKDANHSGHYYGRKHCQQYRCSARDAHKILYFQVCTAFLALSLIEEGYTVYANAEASGALSERISSDANDRMRAAGVHVLYCCLTLTSEPPPT